LWGGDKWPGLKGFGVFGVFFSGGTGI
jgi:hypothetical protein